MPPPSSEKVGSVWAKPYKKPTGYKKTKPKANLNGKEEDTIRFVKLVATQSAEMWKRISNGRKYIESDREWQTNILLQFPGNTTEDLRSVFVYCRDFLTIRINSIRANRDKAKPAVRHEKIIALGKLAHYFINRMRPPKTMTLVSPRMLLINFDRKYFVS